MPITQLYHQWLKKLKELVPKERKTRLKNVTYLLLGMYQSRSVHLSRIAAKSPWLVTLPSATRRLSRLVANTAIVARNWYEPIAQSLLDSMARSTGEIRLIIDGSKVGFHHQLLIVALAYRRRAIPLAWCWVPYERGHSSAKEQLALLGYLRGLLPSGVTVLLVGDAEFGSIELMKGLDAWSWRYVLRQKSHLVQRPKESWHQFASYVQEGESLALGPALLTQQHAYPVRIIAHWRKGDKDPWLLATNLTTKRQALQAYKRRMWIEGMFGDFKSNGFDLESTHLCHPDRLSRLTLAVVLLYVWLLAFGSRIVKSGQRRLVDRNDRRDLSLFRIGFTMVERRLVTVSPIPVYLIPYP